MLIGDLKGTPHDGSDLVGGLWFNGPFHHRFGHLDKIVSEERIAQAHARILLARSDKTGTRALKQPYIMPMALPSPGATCTLASGVRPVACA